MSHGSEFKDQAMLMTTIGSETTPSQPIQTVVDEWL
jgi:hypothetical protein